MNSTTANPRRLRRYLLAIALGTIVVSLSAHALAATPAATSWPTLHKDNQRSGYTEQVLNGPYERKWFRDFHDEMIASRVEAIVAEGKAFVGTFAGNLHAMKVEDGSDVWTFKAAGPIGHSPCYLDGKLYVGSEGERFDRGYVYCVNAADGKEIWRTPVGGGVWVAPACDDKTIYFGDRSGSFHAVLIADGKELWKYQTAGMILTPASITEDGQKIVFASQDMHVYCVDPAGKLLWKSAKLGGLSMRDYAPTIWKGLAIIRTNPAIAFHDALGMRGSKILGETQKAIPVTAEDEVIQDKWGTYAMKYTERRLAAERKAISDYLAGHPEERTFYALNIDDGKEPWAAPVPYNGGLHNPGTPPTFNPKTGDLYLWSGSALSNYSAGVPGGPQVLGKLNRDSGLVDIIWHKNLRGGKEAIGWSSEFSAPADETQALSLMGNIILNTHQGIIGGLNLDTLKWHPNIYSARDSYGGIFGVRYNPTPQGMQGGFYAGTYANHNAGKLTMMPNEWHGPARGVAAIADGRFFWVVGSQVICLGGPDVATTATGGLKPPTIQRRTPGVAGGANLVFSVSPPPDESIQPKPITAVDLKAIVEDAPTAPAGGALAAELRPRLEAAVTEVIDGGPWAPLIIELGMHDERHFWRTADTMQIIAQSMPMLSPEVQKKAKAYLDRMFESGAPLTAPTQPAKGGQRREDYDIGNGSLRRSAENNPIYSAGIGDLYAIWAYAHYANAWDKVTAKAEQIQQVYSSAKPVAPAGRGRGGSSAEDLNNQIAGTIAYIRIMTKADRAADAQAAMEKLASLATQRAHHERTDRRIVTSVEHHASIPRYAGFVPEIGAILRANAKDELTRNVRDMMIDLPIWYQAFSERLIGGENYCSPPTLARGLFAAAANGLNAPATELARYIDQPWCKADLYYIEKLTAAVQAQ